jgi:L-gulonate 5-dehydrogenase
LIFLGEIMKGIVFPKPYAFEIQEMEIPAVKEPDDILVKIKAGGICGSDMHGFHGTSAFVNYPLIPGHEVSGEVVETGAGVTDVKIGDHVVLDPANSCGKCYPCSIGRNNVCVDLKTDGAHVPGVFTEYVVRKRRKLYKISSSLSWEYAAVVEPFTIAAQAASRGRVSTDDTVLITGAGPIGLVILQACKLYGAKCVVSDLSAPRLERASQNGADYVFTAGENGIADFLKSHPDFSGFTLAIDAAGSPSLLPQILENMLPAGRVVILGFSMDITGLRQLDITKRELDIMGSRLSCGQFPKAIEWVEKKLVDPGKIITHRFYFTEIGKAIELYEKHRDECCKIVLNF